MKCKTCDKSACDSCGMCSHCGGSYWGEMRWRSVKDKSPPLKEMLLFFNGKREITIGVTNEIATHWMPLPNPPEE